MQRSFPRSDVAGPARLLLAIVAMALVALACGGGMTGTDPPPPDAALVEAGSELYSAHCAECHGADLRGTDRGPSHLSRVYEPSHHGDDAFWLAVVRGSPQHHWRFGDMAAVPGLSREDVDAIVAFVRQVQREEGFEPYPP